MKKISALLALSMILALSVSGHTSAGTSRKVVENALKTISDSNANSTQKRIAATGILINIEKVSLDDIPTLIQHLDNEIILAALDDYMDYIDRDQYVEIMNIATATDKPKRLRIAALDTLGKAMNLLVPEDKQKIIEASVQLEHIPRILQKYKQELDQEEKIRLLEMGCFTEDQETINNIYKLFTIGGTFPIKATHEQLEFLLSEAKHSS